MRGLSESRGCLEKCGQGRVGNTGNDDGQGLWRRHENGNREARKADETEVIKEASQLNFSALGMRTKRDKWATPDNRRCCYRRGLARNITAPEERRMPAFNIFTFRGVNILTDICFILFSHSILTFSTLPAKAQKGGEFFFSFFFS